MNKRSIFAIKVGKLWATEQFGEVTLKEIPQAFGLKDASRIIEKTGGEVFTLNPVKMDEAEFAQLANEVCDD